MWSINEYTVINSVALFRQSITQHWLHTQDDVTQPKGKLMLYIYHTIMIDQKQLENVGCFKYLGSMLTNDGRCMCEIKSRIALVKAAFNKKRALFTCTLDLNWGRN